MINKKRKELIIQNLQSISSEVRINSIRQLLDLPLVADEEKINHISKLFNDTEPSVVAAAKKAVARLKENTKQESDNSSLKSSKQFTNIGGGINKKNDTPFTLPGLTETKGNVSPVKTQLQPKPNKLTLASLVEVNNKAASDNVARQNTSLKSEESNKNINLSAQISLNVSENALQNKSLESENISNTNYTEEEFIDPPDSSLLDLNTIKTVPEFLSLIKSLGTNKPSGHLGYLLKLAEHFQEEVALTALQAIINLKDERAPEQALKLLAKDGFSSQRRFLMLKIVMGATSIRNTPLLENLLLKETDVIIKSGLVKVFARNTKDKGIATLIKCLQDADPRVRANTIEVIEGQNISGCDEYILKLLHDGENRVKVNAAKYLIKNGYSQPYKILRSMLVSSEVWLRDSVIFALGEIGDQASMTLLKAALKDPNQGIRLSVLKAMAKINTRMARQIIQAASRDPDPVVAQVAVSLWEKIKDTPEKPYRMIQAKNELSGETKANRVQKNTETNGITQEVKPVKTSQETNEKVSKHIPNNTAVELEVSNKTIPNDASDLSLPSMEAKTSTAQNTLNVNSHNNLSEKSNRIFATTKQQANIHSEKEEKNIAESKHSVLLSSLNEQRSREVTPECSGNLSGLVDNKVKTEIKSSVSIDLPAANKVSNNSALPSVNNGKDVSLEGYKFKKARAAELYKKMISNNMEALNSAAKDLPFIMGEDQMVLLSVAVKSQAEIIRLTAAKILSRKRDARSKEMLNMLKNDSSNLVKTLVEKALLIRK